MARLVLLGVVHGDPSGEPRLLEALRRIRPSVVTLELARYSIDFRMRHGPRLRAILDRRLAALGILDDDPGPFAWLRRYLDLPFEWTGAARFAAEAGAETLPVGDARDAAAFLDLVEEELLDPANLSRLALGDLVPDPEGERARARRFLDEPERYVPAGERHLLALRDSRIARAIRGCLPGLPPSAVVAHVAGWEHLVFRPDLPNLARALSDLSPERLLVV